LLHPLLAARWSPTTFDVSYELAATQIEALLEAARWALSAGNSQPWAFIVAWRGDATHARLVRHLARSAGAWAPTASLLVANLAHRYVEDTDWEYSEFSLYDLGQAVAHMTVQAQALGLHVRQFRAFDRACLAAEFAVPDHWEVATMAAVGKSAAASAARSAQEPRSAPRLTDAPSRQRRSIDDILWPVTGGTRPPLIHSWDYRHRVRRQEPGSAPNAGHCSRASRSGSAAVMRFVMLSARPSPDSIHPGSRPGSRLGERRAGFVPQAPPSAIGNRRLRSSLPTR
jgi:nitroreductase